MASPTTKLRTSFATLLASLTYTKSSGSVSVEYFERHPSGRPHFPYVKYVNCFLTPENAKSCNGWGPLVVIEVVTGFTRGHGSFNFADEIEEAVIALVTDKPFALDFSPTYALISSNVEGSQYIEEITELAIGKKKISTPYNIIRKLTEFRLQLQEL